MGIHSAADSFRGSRVFIDMLGGEFLTHPEHHEFNIEIVKKDYHLTTRMPDFSVYDEWMRVIALLTSNAFGI